MWSNQQNKMSRLFWKNAMKKNLIFNKYNSIFFWGSRHECYFLSNFYPCKVVFRDLVFPSSEHLYMWKKARYFNDIETSDLIVKADTAKEAKKLGRSVKGFDESQWSYVSGSSMMSALLHKFQNEDLKQMLIDTKEKYLVEASPVDKIWGIGLSPDDQLRFQSANWTGLNLLGTCLMQVRTFYSTTGSP